LAGPILGTFRAHLSAGRRQPRQGRIPGEHETRDPHADERRQRRYAEIVERSGRNGILEFSKIEAGKLTPRPFHSTWRRSATT
jgi:hypothetical protein